jgi:predicted permease
MFIILAIGLGCGIKGLITKEGNKTLSAVALYIVNPLLIFMSYQSEYSSELLHGLLWSFLLSGTSFAVMILLSTFIISKKREDHTLERFSVVYSNCGFIGIPLIRGIYGDEGVLYLTAYITLFNILVWTHGLMTMKESRDMKSFVKALRSPSVIAVFIGLICYVTQLRLPDMLDTSLRYISDMNTPLAMLIAGSAASQTNFVKAVKNPGLYLVAGLKLLALPMVSFLVLMLIGAPHIVLIVVTIASACPVATTGTMFAIQFDKNPERCSEYFAVTTLLSGITLPIVTFAAEMISQH